MCYRATHPPHPSFLRVVAARMFSERWGSHEEFERLIQDVFELLVRGSRRPEFLKIQPHARVHYGYAPCKLSSKCFYFTLDLSARAQIYIMLEIR